MRVDDYGIARIGFGAMCYPRTDSSEHHHRGHVALMVCVATVAAALSICWPSMSAAVTPLSMGGAPMPAAVTPQAAADGLNRMRAASGLPPVVLDATMSAACDAHNAYMQLNKVLSHEENPRLPGYTPQGDNAGRNGILSTGGTGSVPDNSRMWTSIWTQPWSLGPWHEAFMLHPAVTRIGYADSHGFHCLTAVKGRSAAAGETYSFPASGMTGVPPGGETSENPAPPQDLVGLVNAPVGFNIMLWHARPDRPQDLWTMAGGYNSAVTSATLTGPGGPRPVSVVSARSDVNPSDVNIVIPHAPYKSNSRYTLDVVFDDGTPYRVSFTTGHYTPPTLEMVVRGDTNEVGVSVSHTSFYDDPGVVSGNLPDAVMTRPDGTTQALPLLSFQEGQEDAWRGKITMPGRYTVCVTFGEEPQQCQSLDTSKPHLVCRTTGRMTACDTDPGSGKSVEPVPANTHSAKTRRALHSLLEQVPPYRVLARHRTVRQKFIAPGPGTLRIDWYIARRKTPKTLRRIHVAHGSLRILTGGRHTVSLTLSKRGGVRIRQVSRLTVIARAAFTPRTGRPIAVSRTFTLRR